MTIINNSTGAFFERSTSSLSDLRKRAEAIQVQLGRGERLSRSSDDPVAASRLRLLSRADHMSTIDLANANRAMSDLSLADSALSTFADYIGRAKELAVQAGNDTLTAQQRASIGTEFEQIHAQLVTLANARDSAGHALFGGQTAGNAYSINPAGNAQYDGTPTSGDVPIGEGQSVTRSLTGPEFLSFSVNGNPTDLMAVVKSLADALQGAVADPAQAARDSLASLDAGMEALTTSQTVVGTRLAWIDLTIDRATNQGELRASEEAEIGGTDLAASVADLQEVMLVLEASQASFAKLAKLSLFDMVR